MVCAFIDAANLFYGGEKSLGWKIDYKKLLAYLKNKFSVGRAYYYAGLDLGNYRSKDDEINLPKVVAYFRRLLQSKKLKKTTGHEIEKYIQRVKFYIKLNSFGYRLRLKPTKIFHSGDKTMKKANCDVDLTFDLMRYMSQYDELVILSGDGDFAPVLKYLKKKRKKVHILARAERTAKEIKQLAGSKFMDFTYIRKFIEFEPK